MKGRGKKNVEKTGREVILRWELNTKSRLEKWPQLSLKKCPVVVRTEWPLHLWSLWYDGVGVSANERSN